MSIKTTCAGLGAIFATLASIAHHVSENGALGLAQVDWTTSIAALVTGWGLMCARDHSVTSEQAGLVTDRSKTSSGLSRGPLMLLACCLALGLTGCVKSTLADSFRGAADDHAAYRAHIMTPYGSGEVWRVNPAPGQRAKITYPDGTVVDITSATNVFDNLPK